MLLDDGAPQSNSELELLRDALYALARVTIAAAGSAAHAGHQRTDGVDGELIEAIEERAAILELEAGMNRLEAERRALELYFETK